MLVNSAMKKNAIVLGKAAPAARMTKSAALLVATTLSVPTYIILTLVDWIFL
ncbi:hypothetical protein [Phaeobacter sp. HF9A]|uniref:hypothetical protein n=1 Tax=Phaeobacter sp. HF9A TaxID=2721561 RepID=UPI001430B625|nr:hypothetical protein [Phaeobacter sp. HF9A]NIZ15612.1 hypothetical protein [Phaeobacter sp. HF9A]